MRDLREIMINTLDKCGTLDSYVKRRCVHGASRNGRY